MCVVFHNSSPSILNAFIPKGVLNNTVPSAINGAVEIYPESKFLDHVTGGNSSISAATGWDNCTTKNRIERITLN